VKPKVPVDQETAESRIARDPIRCRCLGSTYVDILLGVLRKEEIDPENPRQSQKHLIQRHWVLQNDFAERDFESPIDRYLDQTPWVSMRRRRAQGHSRGDLARWRGGI